MMKIDEIGEFRRNMDYSGIQVIFDDGTKLVLYVRALIPPDNKVGLDVCDVISLTEKSQAGITARVAINALEKHLGRKLI
jgi:hypothetical protein